jgi:hypothetical protein
MSWSAFLRAHWGAIAAMDLIARFKDPAGNILSVLEQAT